MYGCPLYHSSHIKAHNTLRVDNRGWSPFSFPLPYFTWIYLFLYSAMHSHVGMLTVLILVVFCSYLSYLYMLLRWYWRCFSYTFCCDCSVQVMHLDAEKEMMSQCVALLGKFIAVREPNIRYLGLVCWGNIWFIYICFLCFFPFLFSLFVWSSKESMIVTNIML